MADLLFIGLMVVFFGFAVVLVRVCDRIIGADDDVIVANTSDEAATLEVAA